MSSKLEENLSYESLHVKHTDASSNSKKNSFIDNESCSREICWKARRNGSSVRTCFVRLDILWTYQMFVQRDKKKPKCQYFFTRSLCIQIQSIQIQRVNHLNHDRIGKRTSPIKPEEEDRISLRLIRFLHVDEEVEEILERLDGFDRCNDVANVV